MLNWINRKMKRKGFTLIEMVIVIAILGILIAIAVPRLSGFRDDAQDSADDATKATIIKAAELYAATNNLTDASELYGLEVDDLENYLDLEDISDWKLSYSEEEGFTVTGPRDE